MPFVASKAMRMQGLLWLATNDVGDVIVWSLLLFVFILAAFAAVVWMKKRVLTNDEEGAPGVGFSLGDLRQLHKQGKMTAEEYEKAKTMLIAATGKGQEVLTDQQKAAALLARAEFEQRRNASDNRPVS